MTTRYIVLPILNRDISMFRSPVLDLSQSTVVKPIEDAHFGRILDRAPERYRYSLNPKSKCVYVTLEDQDDPQRRLRETSVIVRFTMSFMCEKGPLVFSFGLHAEEKRILKPIEFFDVPAGAERQDLASIPFKIRADSNADSVRTYHSTVERAVANHPQTLIALNRINWFLTKSDFEDSVIDLTIGLESLIPGKDELRYRFSLYLAFITEPDPSRRLGRFRLFRALYDTRSRIVHGGDSDAESERNERTVRQGWEDLKKASLSAINYYLYFVATREASGWQEHLQALIIASEPRVVD